MALLGKPPSDKELRELYPEAKSLKEAAARFRNACDRGRHTTVEDRKVSKLLGLPHPCDGRPRKYNKRVDNVPGDKRGGHRKTRLRTPAVTNIFDIGRQL